MISYPRKYVALAIQNQQYKENESSRLSGQVKKKVKEINDPRLNQFFFSFEVRYKKLSNKGRTFIIIAMKCLQQRTAKTENCISKYLLHF